ncbi:MAG: DUF302 domain-containing protein [Schleiferiaceae bacterium]|nr:DUF302 domain-containing protein [Schleiferiaceae bacterium]
MLQVISSMLIVFAMGFTNERKLIEHESHFSFAATQARLEQTLKANQLEIFAVIDHQAGAKKAGLEMSKAVVVIFGNPNVGTSLMQENMALAIDLPLRYLIYETPSGNVVLSYFDITFMESEYGINQPEKLAKIGANLENMALSVTLE